MLSVKFAAFGKPYNSTARPSTWGMSTANVLLKDDTSVISPVLVWAYGRTTSPINYNYCWIENFNRYYYIKDWISKGGGIWHIILTLDVMATYKELIGNSTQYVLRASNRYAPTVIDDFYPYLSTMLRRSSSVASPFAQWKNSGCYVLAIVGSATSDSGAGINYWVLGIPEFRDLLTYMYGNVNYTGVEQIAEATTRTLFNPSQYVLTCKYFPFSPTVIDQNKRRIQFGWYSTTNQVGWALSGNGRVWNWHTDESDENNRLRIPKHPQADSRGDFLNTSAARYTLFTPCWGTIPINPSSIATTEFLRLGVYVDCVSGMSYLTISADSVLIEKINGQVGVEIPFGEVSSDFLGGAASALAGAGSAVAGNYIGVASSIGSVAASLIPQARVSGNIGSICNFEWAFTLSAEFSVLAEGDAGREGRPVCSSMQISIPEYPTGYYKCRDVKISPSASDQESAEIKRIMEEGFYYE